jgi:GGDEF domain-containing protein
VVERVSQETDQPFRFEGRTMHLTASIGCARYPEHGTDVDTLLEVADRSMYKMKRSRSLHPPQRELSQKHVF